MSAVTRFWLVRQLRVSAAQSRPGFPQRGRSVVPDGVVLVEEPPRPAEQLDETGDCLAPARQSRGLGLHEGAPHGDGATQSKPVAVENERVPTSGARGATVHSGRYRLQVGFSKYPLAIRSMILRGTIPLV